MKTLQRQVRAEKSKVTAWLPRSLINEMKKLCRERSVSQQSLIESAIGTFVSPESVIDREAILIRRLNQMDSRLKSHQQSIDILAECFAQYVRIWMFNTSEVQAGPKGINEEMAIIQAKERFKRYITTVTKRLKAGESIYSDVSALNKPDLTSGSSGNS